MCLSCLNFVLFNDDTYLFASGNNVETLCAMINKELEYLDIWFRVDELSLNLTKTSFMVFANKDISNLSICMCCTVISV